MYEAWKLGSKGIHNGLALHSICLLRETSDDLEFLETTWRLQNHLFTKNIDFPIKI